LIENEQDAPNGNRIYFLDNLRTFMIFLVVLYHAGGVYESSGIWASFCILEIYLKKVGLPTFTGATEFGVKTGCGFYLFFSYSIYCTYSSQE
jgi:peptidoglycan/LPS O-acetylase OafA/YrhL